MLRRLRFTFRTIFIVSTLLSCRTTSSSADLKGNVSDDIADLRWLDPDNIPVCWEPYDERLLWNFYRSAPSASPQEIHGYQKTIQSIVQSQYARAGLHLNGWEECKRDSKGIRIAWVNGIPKVLQFGRRINGTQAGLWLMPPQKKVNGETYEPIDYLYVTALHEIGHAVGLRHEASRRDNRGACKAFEQGDFGEYDALAIGDFDRHSVMNYCIFDIFVSEGMKPVLSNGDVSQLKALYFEPVAKVDDGNLIVMPPTKFHWTVTGSEQFQFSLVDASVSDCSKAYYSPPQASSAGIDIDLAAFAGNSINLCLRGRSGENLQSDSAYSAYSFRVGRTPFAFYDGFKPLYLPGEKLYVSLNRRLSSNVEAVRYKVGIESETKCDDAANYSTPLQTIEDLELLLTNLPAGVLRICLLAADNGGAWQAAKTANSFVFFNVKNDYALQFAFLPETHNGLSLTTSRKNYRFILTNANDRIVSQYRYKLAPDKTSCNTAEDYSSPVAADVFSEFQLDDSQQGKIGVCAIVQFKSGDWQPLANASYTYWNFAP